MENKIYYTENVVESAGLLIGPMDNLLYELNYLAITPYEKTTKRAIEEIIKSKIPKEDIFERLQAVESECMLKLASEPELVKHLTSL